VVEAEDSVSGIRGGCRCGAVRYTLALDALPRTYACHCRDCQTWTGSAFSQQTFVPDGALDASGPLVVYEQLFGVVPLFDREETALVWSLAGMNRQLLGDCPELAQSNDKLAAEYIARLDLMDVVARVRASVMSLLPSGRCSKVEVARALHMSQATLQARLAERGTTFTSLFDAARKELALGYLSQSALSVTEVAFRLGFADTSNFARAFKRWTGSSPSAHRLASPHSGA
jgi:AraC-like DNA-binding protein